MNILATQFTLEHKSLDIYTAGCNGCPHCTNCHNPESWDFSKGSFYNGNYKNFILNKIKNFDSLIDNIMIFGGEPLDNPIEEIIILLKDLKSSNKKIWLFTRFEIEEVKDKLKDNIYLIDFIKTGKYIPELSVEKNEYYGINLATSNQKILKRGKDY